MTSCSFWQQRCRRIIRPKCILLTSIGCPLFFPFFRLLRDQGSITSRTVLVSGSATSPEPRSLMTRLRTCSKVVHCLSKFTTSLYLHDAKYVAGRWLFSKEKDLVSNILTQTTQRFCRSTARSSCRRAPSPKTPSTH